ncbi:MAG: RDD family protein [Acidimicrobiales bacterium]
MPGPANVADHRGCAVAPSGVWRRGIARILDQTLIAVIAVAVGAATDFGVLLAAAAMLGTFVYFVAAVLVGGSVGKRLLGLAIAPAEPEPPDLMSAALRESFVLLNAIPVLGQVLAIVAWITIAEGIGSDADGRAWHDRLGRTVVTRSVPRAT